MAVMGRDIGVGQRVAERDDRARLPRGDDVDAADEVPVVGEAANRHELFRSEISRRRYVVGLPRAYRPVIPKLVGRSAGRCTLTARSDNGANSSSTGSLTTNAPTAIVALASPPKVSRRLEPGTSAGPALRRPTQAAPIDNGRV